MHKFLPRDLDSVWDAFSPQFQEPSFGAPANAVPFVPGKPAPGAACDVFGHYADRGPGRGAPPPDRGPGRGRLSQEELHELLEDSPPVPKSAPKPPQKTDISKGHGKLTQEELRDLLE